MQTMASEMPELKSRIDRISKEQKMLDKEKASAESGPTATSGKKNKRK
jgi:hypothetical protein